MRSVRGVAPDPRPRVRRAARLLAAAALGVLAPICIAAPADAYIYWTEPSGAPRNAGEIDRANLDGTGVKNAFVTGNGVAGVAVDGAHIYWTNHGPAETNGPGTIGRANLDGTNVDQNFIVGASAPIGVAVDGAHIYWANHGSWAIGRANLDGTGVDQSFITSYRGAGDPIQVAVDGQHIYWSDASDGTTIVRASIDGTNVDPNFITGASAPDQVAVDAAHVYWANAETSTLGRANLDGTNVDQNFITGISDTYGVAVDGAHVYWGDNAEAPPTTGRANLDGSGVDHFFIPGGAGFAMAVDSLGPQVTGPAGNPLGLPSNKRCVDTRKWKFKLHHPRGSRILDVLVKINGKKKLHLHVTDGSINRLTLKKLPQKKFKVEITATQNSGAELISVRTYRGCKKSRPHSVRGHR
jgi:virginiamycin B lyase